MVAAAERSVIITLKLQPDAQNQAIAALTSSQAQSVVTAGNEAYEKLQAVHEESMKRITEVQKVQTGLRNDIDEHEQNTRIGRMEHILSKLTTLEEQRTQALETEEQKREKIRLANIKKQEKEAKELAKKLEEAEKTRIEGRQKANEAAVVAVQGMADMVEGAAKLGLVSEQNFEKFAKYFLMIKEGIRVVKGFSDTIWKSYEALVELGKATKAAATANEILAASQGKAGVVSAGSGAAQVAGSSVGTASKVGGGVAAGGTLAVGAKVAAGLALAAAELIAFAAVLAEIIQAVGRLVKWIGGWEQGGWTESTFWATGEMRDEQKKLEQNQKRTDAAERKLQKLIESRAKFEDEESKKAALAGDLRASRNEVRDAYSGAGYSVDPATNYEQARVRALEEVKVAEQAILNDRKTQEDRISKGQWASVQNRERVMKQLEESQGNLVQLEKDRLKVIADQKQQIKEQLKAEKEKVQVAQDALKSEKQQLLERYGRLDNAQRNRVDEISRKPAAQRTRQDIKDLEDAGLAGDIGANYYAKIGAGAGGNSVLNNLGLLNQQEKEVEKARKKEEEKQRELARQKSLEDQVQARYQDEAERRHRIVNQRVGLSAEIQGVREEDIAGYQNGQPSVVQEIQKGNDNLARQSAEVVNALNANTQAMQESLAKMRDAIQSVSAEGSDNINQLTLEIVRSLGANLSAMNEALEDMKKEIDKNRAKKKAYSK
jgi:hypothetical protein